MYITVNTIRRSMQANKKTANCGNSSGVSPKLVVWLHWSRVGVAGRPGANHGGRAGHGLESPACSRGGPGAAPEGTAPDRLSGHWRERVRPRLQSASTA